jgi:hypothetical protein
MHRRAMWTAGRAGVLAGVALLLALGGNPVQAATLTVTATNPNISADGRCSLIEAIVNANADARLHADCVAGSGTDAIVLPAGSVHTLTAVNNSTFGPSGLPVITSRITHPGAWEYDNAGQRQCARLSGVYGWQSGESHA